MRAASSRKGEALVLGGAGGQPRWPRSWARQSRRSGLRSFEERVPFVLIATQPLVDQDRKRSGLSSTASTTSEHGRAGPIPRPSAAPANQETSGGAGRTDRVAEVLEQMLTSTLPQRAPADRRAMLATRPPDVRPGHHPENRRCGTKVTGPSPSAEEKPRRKRVTNAAPTTPRPSPRRSISILLQDHLDHVAFARAERPRNRSSPFVARRAKGEDARTADAGQQPRDAREGADELRNEASGRRPARHSSRAGGFQSTSFPRTRTRSRTAV